MDAPPAFHAVQVQGAGEGRGAVQFEDEFAVVLLHHFRVVAVFLVLPALPFVFAEVLHDEGAHFFDAEKPLRAVWMANLPRSQVIHRLPSFSATAAVVPLPQKQSRTRSPAPSPFSFVEALITLLEGLPLLRRIIYSFCGLRVDDWYIRPDTIYKDALNFVQINFDLYFPPDVIMRRSSCFNLSNVSCEYVPSSASL